MCAYTVAELEKMLSVRLGCRVLGKAEGDTGRFDFSVLNVPAGQTYEYCCRVNDFERGLFGNCRGRFSAMAYTPEETMAEFPEEMEDYVSFMFANPFERSKSCSEEIGSTDYDAANEEFALAA